MSRNAWKREGSGDESYVCLPPSHDTPIRLVACLVCIALHLFYILIACIPLESDHRAVLPYRLCT